MAEINFDRALPTHGRDLRPAEEISSALAGGTPEPTDG